MTIPQGAKFDITIFQGGNYARTFAWRLADATTPIPLNGYSGAAQVRTRPGGDLLAEFTVVVHQTVDLEDPDCGTVDISLSPDDTAAIPSTGAWDLALTNGDAAVVYLLQGKAILDRRVTVLEDD